MKEKKHSVLVILCSFNRKNKTIRCLSQIYDIFSKLDILFEVVLVDDASTDGTPNEAESSFNELKLIKTDGGLFWAGSMRYGFEAAWNDSYDSLLVINDDVCLIENRVKNFFNNALKIKDFKNNKSPIILVGSMKSNEIDNKLSYGGQKIMPNIIRPKFQLVEPSNNIQEVDTCNMNFTLINSMCISKFGFLSDCYQHSLADFDYGLTVSKNLGSVFLMPNYVGLCERNDIKDTWRDQSLNFFKRYELMSQPKGMPFSERVSFVKRNFNFFKILSVFIPFLILVKDEFSIILNNIYGKIFK